MKILFTKIFTAIMIFLLGSAMLSNIYAQNLQYGIRTGINDSHKENLDLSVYEIYIHTVPPVHFITENIFGSLNITYEAAFSVLNDKEKSSLLFSMGPILKLINYKNIISVTTGLKPSLLSNHVFNNFDLGGPINFKSHISFTIEPTREIRLGYRFEHISNAGLYDKNPGVNIHYFEIIYVI